MYSQNDNVAVLQVAGMVTVWARVSVCGLAYPSSQAAQEPECGTAPSLASASTPAVEVHGEMRPVSKPGLPISCCAVHPVPAELTVQLNAADPDAPVVSVAVTVTLEVPAVVGVPVISP